MLCPDVGRLLSRSGVGAVSFSVYRSAGAWVRGRLESAQTEFSAVGVIQPAGKDTLDQLPEGDRVGSAIVVRTQATLSCGGENTPPDEILWQGARYRVLSVRRWDHYGYCEAVAVRRDWRETE